jgi:hypothetical protein
MGRGFRDLGFKEVRIKVEGLIPTDHGHREFYVLQAFCLALVEASTKAEVDCTTI